MRGLKSTIALVVILLGLVGYIYFVESKRPAAGTDTKPKAFEVTADDIEELQIKTADGQTTHLQKTGDTWAIVEPEKTDADTSELASVTSGLASLEVQRVVDESPAELAPYGLNPPKVDVGFRVKGQKDFRRIFIGEKTPTGGDLYAKRPDEKRVFLISSYLDSTFNKTPFDLRDKAILKFESDKADGLEIAQGATAMQFAKTGSTEWKIVKPIMARGEYGSIESLVSRLSSAKMQKLIAAEAPNLRTYGLDAPAVRATVTTGSAKATLLIGKTDKDATYAKDASRPVVFTVEQPLIEELKKGVADYRRKDLFDFRTFTATQVKIQRGAETFGVEKSADKDGKEVWRNIGGMVVDSAKVEDTLNKLSGLRAQSFETGSHPSLKSPVFSVTARFNENSMETVTFGRSGDDVFAARSDEAGTAKLETNAFDEAMKALDVLK